MPDVVGASDDHIWFDVEDDGADIALVYETTENRSSADLVLPGPARRGRMIATDLAGRSRERVEARIG